MELTGRKIHPQIKRVQDKYWSKLPKDDLKRFAKEVSQSMRSLNLSRSNSPADVQEDD